MEDVTKLIDQIVKIEHPIKGTRFPSAKPLYHYTSAQGLLGILGTKDDEERKIHLHFTLLDCVNDQAEGITIIDDYTAICEHLYSKHKIKKQYYMMLKSILPERKMSVVYYPTGSEIQRQVRTAYTPYVCCFSLNGDSLPMWNYYSQGAQCQGYNIKTNAALFDCYFQGFMGMKTHELDLYEVKYDDSAKKQEIEDIIMQFSESFFTFPEAQELIKSAIKSYLTELHIMYKRPCFMHEQEVRAVLYIPQSIPDDGTGYEKHEIKYKTKNGLIIPYVDLVLPESQKRWITGATIGPLIERGLAKQTLVSFMNDYGYTRCEEKNIVCSEIPVRF